MEAFHANMDDARLLVSYARGLKNRRTNRMRKELRDKFGEALYVPAKDRDRLDCIESDDLFIVLKPGSSLGRQDFTELRPLLRQALVAACAALETYVADIAMKYVGPVVGSESPPRRFRDIPLTVGDWFEIEKKYTARGWGIRKVVEGHLRRTSSPAPSQIGVVLATVGVNKWEKKVDAARDREYGTTGKDLNRIAERRNLIAHTGDRKGRGRATLTVGEVERDLLIIADVVNAIDRIMEDHEP